MKQPIPWVSAPLHILHEHDLEEQGTTKHDVKVEPRHLVQVTQVRREDHAIRHQREASALELFYDLFVVANLATVTARNEIVDASTLKAYIGFFTLLWFTWLQTILFDVRFSTDSVFHHVHKAVSFAVMVAFVICAATYDTLHIRSTINGFKALSLVLMTSRATLAIQYGVTFWYARDLQKARIPLICTIVSLGVSAAAFFAIFWGFGDKPMCYIAWYAICAAEAISIVAISCKWRIVSFRKTHLIERLGLLTLIIMGEGILGLSRTTYILFEALRKPTAESFGELICAVLLTYFIFMLYFSHVEHDKFGSIRQQFWMILHYPLHVAILLTVEGSSFMMLSRVISGITTAWGNLYPLHDYPDWVTFFEGYLSAIEVVSDISQDMESLFNITFRERTELLNLYNYTKDIEMIKHIAQPFNSSEWQNEASETINQLWSGMERAIYDSFGIDGLEPPDHKPSSIEEAATPEHVMDAVFLYFYIAAGCLLLVLAVMYVFSKKEHTKDMWLSVGVKSVVGIALITPVSANWVKSASSIGFYLSPWTVVVVMLGYFTVLVSDHLIYLYTHRKRPVILP